jgi:hypothetical protein
LRASRNLRMVARLDGILEDEIDSVPARDAFWHQVRKKLGKLRRLSQSDILVMVSARICEAAARPAAAAACCSLKIQVSPQ